MTPEEIKEMQELGQKQTEAVTELRAANDELKTQMASTNEKFEKASTALDEMETKNQEFAKKFQEQEADKKELDEKLEGMEKKLFRLKKSGVDSEEKSDAYKACVKLIQFGKESVSADEMKAYMESEEIKLLRTDSDPDGGVLVTPELAREIIKPITEISGMRQVARVMNTSSKSVIINKRTKLLNGGWVGER